MISRNNTILVVCVSLLLFAGKYKEHTYILYFREISLGWQKLGVDTRTAWVVGGGRILSHREGQELIVRDFRRWKE